MLIGFDQGLTPEALSCGQRDGSTADFSRAGRFLHNLPCSYCRSYMRPLCFVRKWVRDAGSGRLTFLQRFPRIRKVLEKETSQVRLMPMSMNPGISIAYYK
jgi:hypothetical protein